MTIYRITAPEPKFDGHSAGVRFVDGVARVDTEVSEQRRALSYFKQAGYIVEELDANGDPIGEPTVDAPEGVAPDVENETGNENPLVTDPGLDPDARVSPGQTQAVVVGEQGSPDSPGAILNPEEARHDAAPQYPPLPAPGANKPEWIQAAIDRGWTYEQADDLTKQQLIERLTSDDPTPPADSSTEDPA